MSNLSADDKRVKWLKSVQQSKNYAFTEYNMEMDWKSFWDKNNDVLAYIRIGEEICPSTKRLHYQGWLQFNNKKRFGGMKKLLPKANFGACIASEEHNDNYCKKDNKYVSYGKWTKQGCRSDLELLQKDIRNGMKKDEIMEKHFSLFCRHRNGINEYLSRYQNKSVPKWRNLEIYYIYGSTGTGKTRASVKYTDYKTEGYNLKWWDGYNGEESILIDEYNNDVNITKLLNLLDGYKLRLEVKGGTTYARWNKVYITSNLSPHQLHPNAKKRHIEALFRRITMKVDMDKPMGAVLLELMSKKKMRSCKCRQVCRCATR